MKKLPITKEFCSALAKRNLKKSLKMNKPTKLVITENRWWEKYEELNSCDFTYKNSARYLCIPEIYKLSDDDILIPMKYINDEFDILGYTLNPPIDENRTPEEYVAIMFENKETFEKVWFHFCR